MRHWLEYITLMMHYENRRRIIQRCEMYVELQRLLSALSVPSSLSSGTGYNVAPDDCAIPVMTPNMNLKYRGTPASHFIRNFQRDEKGK
ncbi:hypothetical protein QCA50_014563 [Cerrena zonata]|uniref:Uncharacterized protein n=1 Tax=Cerrena zonata TaxID=2478898 RepID=A0AAW0FKZ9_9APHY